MEEPWNAITASLSLESKFPQKIEVLNRWNISSFDPNFPVYTHLQDSYTPMPNKWEPKVNNVRDQTRCIKGTL